MLTLSKNGEIFKEIPLSTLDPISLESYSNIIKEDILLCMLVCENTRYIYRSKDIIEMRYDLIYNTIHVYLLKDPISREEVKDVYYFKGETRKKENITFTEGEVLINNRNINFNYLCNEKEMFENDIYKKIVLGFEYCEDELQMYVWIFLVVFVFCMVTGILLKYSTF